MKLEEIDEQMKILQEKLVKFENDFKELVILRENMMETTTLKNIYDNVFRYFENNDIQNLCVCDRNDFVNGHIEDDSDLAFVYFDKTTYVIYWKNQSYVIAPVTAEGYGDGFLFKNLSNFFEK